MNPTMVSRITAQQCAAGLIRREARIEDRRAATVSATSAGRRMRDRINRERARTLESHLQTLDHSDRESLLAALPALEHLAERIPRP